MPETMGKYEIVRRIGTGGFGAVFEARDPLLKRTVAVKTCEIEDPEIQARFFREAELAGSLHHRNITTIHDSGIHEGKPYLVQEFLDGEDLDSIISRETLLVERAVDILVGIAYGLEHAHAAGVIHRDIKPANIRVLEDGTVKIMDFGIAKSLRTDVHLTDTGATLGTSAYLAPEQIRGQKADLRTDIFAFGVLAYELLTGRKPFSGETLPELFDAILRGRPDGVTALRPEVPAALASLVDQAMRTNPDQRYPSATELRRELIEIQKALRSERAENALAPSPSTAPIPLRAAEPMDAVQDTAAFEARTSSRRIQAGSRVTLRAAAAAAIVFLALSGVVVLLWPAREATTPEEAATSSVPAAVAPQPAPAVALPPAPVPVSAAEPVTQRLPDTSAPAAETVGAARGRDDRSEPGRIVVRYNDRATRLQRRIEEPRLPSDRYTRAAMEPGLSDETRAHILLQSALSHHEAGDDRYARASLRAAFALSPELEVPSEAYGAPFAELAESVRSSSRLPRLQ